MASYRKTHLEATMEILFISDYVCPYCLVAKEALSQALALTGLEAKITWQPLELTPDPKERVDTYHDARRRAGYQVLVEPCKQLGLPMKLPPKVIPRPYTRLAFEGWYYACDHGRGDQYNDLVYRAYFIDEQDIGDIAVLSRLAAQAGLDEKAFTAALEQGNYTQKEQEAVRYAREVLQPTGVPTIYIDGAKVTLNDYSLNEMLRLLTDAAPQSSAQGFCCGPDGC